MNKEGVKKNTKTTSFTIGESWKYHKEMRNLWHDCCVLGNEIGSMEEGDIPVTRNEVRNIIYLFNAIKTTYQKLNKRINTFIGKTTLKGSLDYDFVRKVVGWRDDMNLFIEDTEDEIDSLELKVNLAEQGFELESSTISL